VVEDLIDEQVREALPLRRQLHVAGRCLGIRDVDARRGVWVVVHGRPPGRPSAAARA
jgi:hypothetical protein